MFTGTPKAPASLGDVHRPRKRPQTPPDTRTQRPHPSSISARQGVSAQSASRLSRAHSLAAIGGAASAKRESPGFRRTASLIATSTHPPSHPHLQCPGTFPNVQPKPRHFSWNFTPETRRLPLKGTQNRASTPAIAHAGLPHGAHFPRLAATAISRLAVTSGQAAPPVLSARLAAPSATAPAKAWSTRRRGIGRPNDGARGSCSLACSASLRPDRAPLRRRG